MTIYINYSLLKQPSSREAQISEHLLRRAKRFIGFRARRELVRLLDPQIRLMAAEIAQRQMNPTLLYKEGTIALFDALDAYRVGKEETPFRQWVIPFIQQRMYKVKNAPH